MTGVALLRCSTGVRDLAAYFRREEAHLNLGVLVLRNAPGDDREDHVDDEKKDCQPPRPRSRRLAWAIPAISVPTLAPPCVESDRQFGTRHGQTDLALHHRSEFEQRPHTLRKRRGSGGGGAEGERRGRDSNPRTRGCPANSFQGCRIQPLCHPSRMTRPKVVDFPAPLKSSMAAARGHARAAVGHATRC